MIDFPLVSIIVPIYNVEKFIGACIKSILNQDYPNIEIIIVDDGSPDKSTIIAENILSSATFRYKIVKQNNEGVSSARNRGINEATSDWIMMIDGDDVVANSYVSSCVNSADINNYDRIVFCEFQIVGKDNTNIPPKWDKGFKEFTKREVLYSYLSRKTQFIVTGMLINRKFLINNNIIFDVECKYSEDVQFVWKVLCRLEKAILIQKPLYNYLRRAESTMTSSSKEKFLTGYNTLFSLHKNYIKKLLNEENFISQFIPRYILAILHAAAKVLSYRDFVILSKLMTTKYHFIQYKKTYDRKIYILTRLFFISPLINYFILRYY